MDFSNEDYINILKSGIRNGYEFRLFKDLKKSTSAKSIFVRHDIDIDLGFAYEMAKLESDLGIHSTYFIMLRSPVYNLFSRENTLLVQKIIDLGHEIGLHYDEGFYYKEEELDNLVKLEATVLEEFFNVNISTVSFHQPSNSIIENKIKLSSYFNTYDKNDFEGIHYISDSNMIFKEDPIELINSNEHERIQILIHPIWWGRNVDSKSTEKIWELGILSSFERMQRQILETERAYGAERSISFKRN